MDESLSSSTQEMWTFSQSKIGVHMTSEQRTKNLDSSLAKSVSTVKIRNGTDNRIWTSKSIFPYFWVETSWISSVDTQH